MSLKQKTIKGIFWSFVSQGSKQISQFFITVVLARLLVPDDFGLVAMATVFTGFATAFNDLGFSRALIQKQDVDETHLSSVFWLNILVGCTLTVFFIAMSTSLANFYGKPALQPVIVMLSLNFTFYSFSIVQQTVLIKDMDFKVLTMRDIIAVVFSGVIGIVCAYHGYGVFSLVYQSLSFSLINSALIWAISPWRPKFIFSISAIKDIFSFGLSASGFNVVNYLSRNIDQLLIGKILGSELLGFYSLAYKIMLYPLQNISWVVTRVMFPAFSKIQYDLKRVCGAYQKMVQYISLVTFPLMCGLFAITPEFINVIFGSKWSMAAPIVRIFCICGLVQSIYTTTTSVLFSQGKPQLLLKLSIANVIFVCCAVLVGIRWGVIGVATAYTVEQLIWTAYVQFISNSLIKMGAKEFLLSIANNFFVSIGMTIIILTSKIFIKGDNLTAFISYLIIGFTSYLVMRLSVESNFLIRIGLLTGYLRGNK